MLDRKHTHGEARRHMTGPGIATPRNVGQAVERLSGIHIQRLGRRATVVTPWSHSMAEAVAIVTGAAPPPPVDVATG